MSSYLISKSYVGSSGRLHGNGRTLFSSSFYFYLLAVFLLLLLSPSLSSSSKPKVTIRGGGATFPQPLYEEWGFAFEIEQPNTDFLYSGVGSGGGVGLILSGDLDYAASDFPQPSAFWANNTGKYLQFPLTAGAVVCPYNLPGFNSSTPIVFDLETLSLIFQGLITNWRDPRILNLNKKLRDHLPDKKVAVVVRSDSSGTTDILSTSLSILSNSWKLGTFTVWSPAVLTANNFKTGPGNSGVLVTVQTTPYSIGYTSLAFLTGTTTTYALMKDPEGEVLTPEYTKVSKSMDNVKFDKYNAGSLVNATKKVNGTWPLGGFSYVLVPIQDTNSRDCYERRQIFKFFRWALTNGNAMERAVKKGYASLTPKVSNYVLDILQSIQCDGDQLLRYEELDQHDGVVYIALLIGSMVMMSVMTALGLYLFFYNYKVKLIAKVYSGLFLLGAIICFLSVIWFYLVPDETWICQLRQWFLGMGFTLFLGALFSRALQIHRIYRTTKYKKIKLLGVIEMVLGSGLTITFQLVIMIVWSAADELKAELSVVDEIDLTAVWACKSDNIWIWIGLEIAFFVAMLFYGVLVSYMIWDWDYKVKFSESKWILICIYNLFITLAAFIPLFATIKIDDDNLFIMVAVGVDFAVASTLVALYAQRFLAPIKERLSKAASMVGSGTGSKRATSTGSSN